MSSRALNAAIAALAHSGLLRGETPEEAQARKKQPPPDHLPTDPPPRRVRHSDDNARVMAAEERRQRRALKRARYHEARKAKPQAQAEGEG